MSKAIIEISKFFKEAKDYFSLVVSIATVFLIWQGLRTWKIQLKGENKFKLSLDILRNLKLTVLAIEEYRYPFYPSDEMGAAFRKYNSGKLFDPMDSKEHRLAEKYVDIERWNRIVEQYNKYIDKVLKMSILLNDYEIDLFKNKRLKDYLLEINKKRTDKVFADGDRKNNENMSEDDREKLKTKYEEINRILFKYDEKDDKWGDELNQYFEGISKKLRKYTK